MSTVTLHIVDDDASVRTALASALSNLPCQVRGHCTAESFLDDYAEDRSECLVLDVGLPGMSGLDLLDRLRRTSAQLPTLVLSANTAVERVVTAMQHGAIGFIEKPPQPTQFVEQVRTMLRDAVSTAETRRTLRRLQTAQARLTARERQSLELLGRGMTSKQIAHELGLSIRTSHIHRTNVMQKLGAESMLEIVQIAALLREAARRSGA